MSSSSRAARKAEKNVKVMKKAEDVEGYRGDAVIDDILQVNVTVSLTSFRCGTSL